MAAQPPESTPAELTADGQPGHATSASPFRVFLLSPANLSGKRAAMLLSTRAQFKLACEVRDRSGAPLGQVFAFVSGLYFRGKLTYANAFGRPPEGLGPGLVISPGEGLLPFDERVTAERLQAWAEVAIDERNAHFTRALVRAAEQLERAHGSQTRFVLLGSVATTKYVRPLATVFGDHLLFPSAFVGRGDMSRGALLLRAVRAQRELDYAPVEGTRLTTRTSLPARPPRGR